MVLPEAQFSNIYPLSQDRVLTLSTPPSPNKEKSDKNSKTSDELAHYCVTSKLLRDNFQHHYNHCDQKTVSWIVIVSLKTPISTNSLVKLLSDSCSLN